MALLPVAGQEEFRALWVDAFNTGLKSAAQVTAVVETARAGNFNAIVAQVRKRGDAYYRNGLEPVAADVAAGFDPLADLLAKAHDTTGGRQRLEVHAWLVTYNIWNSEFGTPPQASHPYRLHPEWLTEKYRADATDPVVRWDDVGRNYMLDPALPAVQQHIFDVSMDVLKRYAVDGLHFDYIRYPDGSSSGGNQPWGYHPDSVARFQKLKNQTATPLPTQANWLQWRREQVTALLRKVYLHAWAAKPSARVSAALITYGSTAPGLGPNDFANQSEAYRRVLQDWNGWLQEGILDLACPMVYKTSTASVESWRDFIRQKQYRRASAIGLGSYLNPLGTTLIQMKAARAATPGGLKAQGILGYSYWAVDNSITATARNEARQAFTDALTKQAAAELYDPGGDPLFATRSDPPPMPWKLDNSRGHLMGFVRQSDGAAAIDGASLILTGPVNRSFVSDGTGFFGSVDLPAGHYTLSVSAPGTVPEIRSVVITGTEVHAEDFLLGAQVLTLTHFSYNRETRQAELAWTSAAGQRFSVEYSEDLLQWQPQVEDLAATGSITTWQTPATPANTLRRWWRVRRE